MGGSKRHKSYTISRSYEVVRWKELHVGNECSTEDSRDNDKKKALIDDTTSGTADQYIEIYDVELVRVKRHLTSI